MKNIITERCPRCTKNLRFGKDKLIDCECGARILLYKLNGNLSVQDVTPHKKQVSNSEVN